MLDETSSVKTSAVTDFDLLLVGDKTSTERLKRELKGYTDKTALRSITGTDITDLIEQTQALMKRGAGTPEDTVIILTGLSSDKIEEFIQQKKQFAPDVPMILFAEGSPEEGLKQTDLEAAVTSLEKAIQGLLCTLERLKFKRESKKLFKAISEGERLAVFIHDDPDPDAMASAMALEKICEKAGTDSTTFHGGTVGHPENEAFIANTGFEMERVDSNEVKGLLSDHDKVVFVDFAQASVNNIVPEDIKPDIILDHHYTNKDIYEGRFVQVRSDVGATSTLMTRHLQDLDMEIDPLLASALLYGIKVDTHDYTKNVYPADYKAITYLGALADEELLDIFESPPLNPETIDVLGRAIQNRKMDHGLLMAFAGEINDRDDLSQVVELLMREEDAVTILVYGILGNDIYMSARCKDLSKNIGGKMKRAFSEIGEAGGHRHSGGGKISLDEFEGEKEAVKRIEKLFKEEVRDR